jgi:hypothetical protein
MNICYVVTVHYLSNCTGLPILPCFLSNQLLHFVGSSRRKISYSLFAHKRAFVALFAHFDPRPQPDILLPDSLSSVNETT